MRTAVVIACTMVVVLLAACAGDSEPAHRDTLTQRQRDSLVGHSTLPGARGVRGALGVADSAAARATQLDSAGRP